jgi:hypothetical protein
MVEAPERFDHVADELQSHGFDITGGEYVDDAATDSETSHAPRPDPPE